MFEFHLVPLVHEDGMESTKNRMETLHLRSTKKRNGMSDAFLLFDENLRRIENWT